MTGEGRTGGELGASASARAWRICSTVRARIPAAISSRRSSSSSMDAMRAIASREASSRLLPPPGSHASASSWEQRASQAHDLRGEGGGLLFGRRDAGLRGLARPLCRGDAHEHLAHLIRVVRALRLEPLEVCFECGDADGRVGTRTRGGDPGRRLERGLLGRRWRGAVRPWISRGRARPFPAGPAWLPPVVHRRHLVWPASSQRGSYPAATHPPRAPARLPACTACAAAAAPVQSINRD